MRSIPLLILHTLWPPPSTPLSQGLMHTSLNKTYVLARETWWGEIDSPPRISSHLRPLTGPPIWEKDSTTIRNKNNKFTWGRFLFIYCHIPSSFSFFLFCTFFFYYVWHILLFKAILIHWSWLNDKLLIRVTIYLLEITFLLTSEWSTPYRLTDCQLAIMFGLDCKDRWPRHPLFPCPVVRYRERHTPRATCNPTPGGGGLGSFDPLAEWQASSIRTRLLRCPFVSERWARVQARQ